ncbi:MAG: transposase [Armatimonadetes bacterium]|nr:transposase [Armatimonadota bacterium]
MTPTSTPYSTNLTDAQWQRIDAWLPVPDPQKGGRPRKYSRREIFNAIFYPLRTGCQWRRLPQDFPP